MNKKIYKMDKKPLKPCVDVFIFVCERPLLAEDWTATVPH